MCLAPAAQAPVAKKIITDIFKKYRLKREA